MRIRARSLRSSALAAGPRRSLTHNFTGSCNRVVRRSAEDLVNFDVALRTDFGENRILGSRYQREIEMIEVLCSIGWHVMHLFGGGGGTTVPAIFS